MSLNNKSSSGFALLYALLITTVTLSVGLILGNIITKQMILSLVVRDSQLAFYAADSGLDCMVYWGLNRAVFDDGADSDAKDNIKCEGVDSIVRHDDDLNNFPYEYYVFFDNGTCADIEVSQNPSGNISYQSNGYNLSNKDANICPVNDRRLVWRLRLLMGE